MASIILGSIGAATGSGLAGAIGGAIGQFAGSMAGSIIDQKLFGQSLQTSSFGSRLKDLSIQTSTYGATIPMVYGSVRVAGNIIWSLPFREARTMQTFTSGGKGASVSHTHAEYAYFASFAVSICEGVIDEVIRIYANNTQINLMQYNIRIYRGTEDQMPDPLIERVQGIGKTPAYRGQAYVVFDDFPLAGFGNRLPNFNFEIKKRARSEGEAVAEDLIESIVMIPGSGEFVYDTVTQYKVHGNVREGRWYSRGKRFPFNQHNADNKPNVILALDQLQSTLPNVKWAAPVVTWFATSLNAAGCQILPGVEFQDSVTRTVPEQWKVGSYTRNDAHLITQIEERCIYGGTINDASIIRLLEEMRRRNLKIMFYPMFFIDTPHKPWRGRMNGDSKSVREFFTKPNGYNRFILHYANLVKGKVDAFVIGSELIGLTKVKDENNNFAAVDELCKLAQQVKNILGNGVIVTYAADWSEYHHTDHGWYNLDKLWACDAIDVIGIDAYFPVTDSPSSVYDIQEIMKGWNSGEGYNYYFNNGNRKDKHELAAPYAWKNLRWWWENKHVNPNGVETAWKPRSKKIWFTEYGFPSVDCCTNQPNVFYDPSSSESHFPIYSSGKPDFKAQRMAITATELLWRNSDMVERKFLWTWDARPYPYWPDLLNVWSDGGSWLHGHWVQGKLGHSTLSGVLASLCDKAGLKTEYFKTNNLTGEFYGLVIDQQSSIRSVIEMLQDAYFFDVAEYNGCINFMPKTPKIMAEITSDELAAPGPAKMDVLVSRRGQESELPKKVDINFINQAKGYQISNQHAMRQISSSQQHLTLNLPIVMDEFMAKRVAETLLYQLWQSRTGYQFTLPPKYMYLKPADLIKVGGEVMRINSRTFSNNLTIKIEASADHIDLYQDNAQYFTSKGYGQFEPLSDTMLQVLDLPVLPEEADLKTPYLLFAICGVGENWKGAVLYMSQFENEGFEPIFSISDSAIMGQVINKLEDYPPFTIDYQNRVIINLVNGQLQSVTIDNLLSGANLCCIGKELLYFQHARLIDNDQYELSGLIRGRQSTQMHCSTHQEGDRFILLNNSVKKFSMPVNSVGGEFYIKAVTYGQTLGETKVTHVKFEANNLKPFTPVNITVMKKDTGQVEIAWTRRSRVTGKFIDYSDIPIGEEKEQYLVNYINPTGMLHNEIVENAQALTTPYLQVQNVNVQQLSSYC